MQKYYEDNKKNGLVADPFTPRTFSETISQMLHNWRSAKSRGTRPKASSILLGTSRAARGSMTWTKKTKWTMEGPSDKKEKIVPMNDIIDSICDRELFLYFVIYERAESIEP